ncbi:transposase [Sorangium sp. So ce119]|uniref:transposase n=1 Tax=Sorangium sp. So ce119 TaxID=3133279 RepID=UPI003F61E59F
MSGGGFRARSAFAHGATEGFNNKARITTRNAYGFRTFEHAEIALYHALGNLPSPNGSPTNFSEEAILLSAGSSR